MVVCPCSHIDPAPQPFTPAAHFSEACSHHKRCLHCLHCCLLLLLLPQKTIVFDVSKRETHHPGGGFKKLARRLKGSFRVLVNKDELTDERLAEASLMVFGSPRAKFSNEEVSAARHQAAAHQEDVNVCARAQTQMLALVHLHEARTLSAAQGSAT